MKLTRTEEIKYALYSIKAMRNQNENGKEIATKYWEDFNLSKEEIYSYFKKKEYIDNNEINNNEDPTPVQVINELASECWEALEYFEFI